MPVQLYPYSTLPKLLYLDGAYILFVPISIIQKGIKLYNLAIGTRGSIREGYEFDYIPRELWVFQVIIVNFA